MNTSCGRLIFSFVVGVAFAFAVPVYADVGAAGKDASAAGGDKAGGGNKGGDKGRDRNAGGHDRNASGHEHNPGGTAGDKSKAERAGGVNSSRTEPGLGVADRFKSETNREMRDAERKARESGLSVGDRQKSDAKKENSASLGVADKFKAQTNKELKETAAKAQHGGVPGEAPPSNSSGGFLGDNNRKPDLIESLATDFVNGKILEGAFGDVLGRNLGIGFDLLNPEILGATDTPHTIGSPGYIPSPEERAMLDEILQNRSRAPPTNK